MDLFLLLRVDVVVPSKRCRTRIRYYFTKAGGALLSLPTSTRENLLLEQRLGGDTRYGPVGRRRCGRSSFGMAHEYARERALSPKKRLVNSK